MIQVFKLICLTIFFLIFKTNTYASYHGGYLGLGLPYLGQMGYTHVLEGDKYSFDLSYQKFSLDFGEASVSLSKPEVMFKWHVFTGAFYVAAGLGRMNLIAEASQSGEKARVEFSAFTLTPSTGWLWGIKDGGFTIGIEVGYQLPFLTDTQISAPGLSEGDDILDDVVEANNELGKTPFPVISFLRIGYLF